MDNSTDHLAAVRVPDDEVDLYNVSEGDGTPSTTRTRLSSVRSTVSANATGRSMTVCASWPGIRSRVPCTPRWVS